MLLRQYLSEFDDTLPILNALHQSQTSLPVSFIEVLVSFKRCALLRYLHRLILASKPRRLPACLCVCVCVNLQSHPCEDTEVELHQTCEDIFTCEDWYLLICLLVCHSYRYLDRRLSYWVLQKIQNGGSPPSWIIIRLCWTTHEVFLLTASLCSNFISIEFVVSMLCSTEYLANLA